MQHTGYATMTNLHKEGAMQNLGHGSMNYLHAAARHSDLRGEVERDHQFAQARAGRTVTVTFRDAVRRSIAVQVLRAGERIAHGAPTAGPARAVAVTGR